MGKLLFTLTVTASLIIAACSTQSGRSIDPVKAAAIRTQIDNRDFTINATRITPNRMSPETLVHPYNLRIKGDSVFSYLPYFGRSYAPVVGTPEGLIFDARITDFKIKEGRRGSTDISFSTRTFEDYYNFRISVFPNGNSSIDVYPGQKEAVSFDGEFRMP